jgi:WD40 repeat protein
MCSRGAGRRPRIAVDANGRTAVSEQSNVQSIALSPGGRRLATGHMDTSLSIWDMEKGRQMHNWYVPDSSVLSVKFSPCGTVLATALEDGNVSLWETESHLKLHRLSAHEGAALSVAFNPADGVTLATGGADGVIRMGH